VGPTVPQQQLNRWINPGRNGHKGPKLSVTELKRRYARNVPDPYAGILEETDSLLLTRDQVDALQKADTAYRLRMDSVWTELSEYLANLPDHFDGAEALKRQEAGVDSAWEVSKIDIQTNLPKILSPIQLRLLPWVAAELMKTTGKVQIRVFMSG
jgi:hypothetical protein